MGGSLNAHHVFRIPSVQGVGRGASDQREAGLSSGSHAEERRYSGQTEPGWLPQESSEGVGLAGGLHLDP